MYFSWLHSWGHVYIFIYSVWINYEKNILLHCDNRILFLKPEFGLWKVIRTSYTELGCLNKMLNLGILKSLDLEWGGLIDLLQNVRNCFDTNIIYNIQRPVRLYPVMYTKPDVMTTKHWQIWQNFTMSVRQEKCPSVCIPTWHNACWPCLQTWRSVYRSLSRCGVASFVAVYWIEYTRSSCLPYRWFQP